MARQRRISAAWKAFRAQPRQGSTMMWMPADDANYQRVVGDGMSSSAVAAPLRWLQRNVVEAPIRVRKRSGDELTTVPETTPIVALLRRPNEYYSWSTLLRAVVADYALDGNGYILAALNTQGRPVELWWAPRHMVTPKRDDDSTELVDYYEYSTGDGMPARIQPIGKDRSSRVDLAEGWAMIHARDGIDPADTTRGISGFSSLLREIYTDIEAAAFTASLLTNKGVPGLVVSPKSDANGLMPVDDDDIRQTKTQFEQATTGRNRGRTIVMTAPTTIETIGFNPQELDLTALRRVPEERITAVMGVPAIVCGLGAGLERSTFANMAEAKESAYEDTVLPMQRDIADTLELQLLPQFETNPEQYEIDFDNTQVRALQEDADKRAQRLVQLVNGGIVTVAEGREGMGLPVRDEHRVYRVPLNLVEVPEGQTMDQALGESEQSMPPVAAASSRGVTKGMRRIPRKLQQRYLTTVERGQQRAMTRFASRLERFFAELGAAAAAAYRAEDPIVESAGDVSKGATDEDRARQASADLAAYQLELANRVIDRLKLAQWRERLAAEFDAMYTNVVDDTIGVVQDVGQWMGIVTNVPDAVRVQVLQAGGTRYQLVNIEDQTAAAIREALAAGKNEGLSVQALERRIRAAVEAGGDGRSVSARAMRIARTESQHAQRMSTLAALDGAGAFATVEAFDNRIGHDDADCMERDGTVFTIAEAYNETESEHPNGTLNFAPFEVSEEGMQE